MNANPALLAAVMKLSDADRFEIAMAILDDAHPSAMDEDSIVAEAARRQDELECGDVAGISLEELIQGLTHRPQSLVK